MRYLEGLKSGQRVGGAVFVAGFTDDLGFEEISNFFKTPINFDAIKTHCPVFTAIHSDNDPYVDLSHSEILKEKLDAKIVVISGKKHFSGSVDDEESCLKLPEALEAVVQIADR
jgi:predicted alpha/beta hydrolase family esterase